MINGTANGDTLMGTANDDTILGNDGNDLIEGGNGDDLIEGGNGDDTIDGGAGNDLISGGFGNDTFTFGAGWGNDTIGDYASGIDQIDMSATGLSFTDLSITQDGNNTLIEDGDGNSILLESTTASEITAEFLNLTESLTTIQGTADDDTLVGTANEDVIQGLDGNDTITATEGGDIIDGGAGFDILELFSELQTAVRATVGSGVTIQNQSSGGESASISFAVSEMANIEGLKSGACDDTLLGDSAANLLDAGGGDDIVEGASGDDTIDAGEGDDTLRGEDGDDHLTPGTGKNLVEGGAGDDVVTSELGDDTLYGGADNDTLDGSANGDTTLKAFGDEGDDVLRGHTDDKLDGGDGNDFIEHAQTGGVLTGGDGDDTLESSNQSTLSGGAGDDVIRASTFQYDDVVITAGTGNDIIEAPSGGTVDAGTGTDLITFGSNSGPIEIDFGADNDSDRIEGKYYWLSELDGTTITNWGAEDAFVIDSSYYNPSITTAVVDGNLEVTISVAADTATFTLVGVTSGTFVANKVGDSLHIRLVDGDTFSVTNEFGGLDASSETTGSNLDGTEQADRFFGDDGNDRQEGAGGDDTLTGEDGNDFLSGGANDDKLYGGEDKDTLSGGEGDDSLHGGGDSDLLEGGAGNDTLDDGNGYYNAYDTLKGGEGDDKLISSDGDQLLDGGNGDDEILSEDGRDTLLGGAGDDTLKDTDSYYVDYLDGGDGNDNLVSRWGNDTVIGGAGDDIIVSGGYLLDGGEGDDAIRSTSNATNGKVNILAGDGADLIYLGKADALVDFGNDTDRDTVRVDYDDLATHLDGTEFDNWGNEDRIVFDISGASYSASGQSYVTQELGDDLVITFTFERSDADPIDATIRINGGVGRSIVLAEAGDELIFKLIGGNTDQTDNGEGGTDFYGTNNNDTITGTNNSDRISGGEGDDTLLGQTGNDTISGGLGDDAIDAGDDNDFATGGDGDDTIVGNNGDDSLEGESGRDSLIGGEGDDKIWGGFNADTIEGGAGDDELNGGNRSYQAGQDNSADLIDGGAGDDTIGGGGGNDTLLGGEGDDKIWEGNNGEAKIFGGEGNDSIFAAGDTDTLDGGDGDDLIRTGYSGGLVLAGSGADTVQSYSGADTIDLGADDDADLVTSTYLSHVYNFNGDVLRNVSYNDRIEITTTSNLTISSEASGDDIIITLGYRGGTYQFTLEDFDGQVVHVPSPNSYGGTHNLIFAPTEGGTYNNDVGGSNVIGGANGDSLTGGAGPDRIFGNAGNDTVTTGGNQDTVFGGDGDDLVLASTYEGRYEGGDGTDTLSFELLDSGLVLTIYSNGKIYGTDLRADHFEVIKGTSHGDEIYGSQAGVQIYGGCGDDTLGSTSYNSGAGIGSLYSGDEGNDVISGRGISDTLLGGNGDDTITNVDGSVTAPDFIDGGAGDDVITFTSKNTFVSGGTGDDYLSGEATGARYSFGAGWGNDTIEDFDQGEERLNFVGSGINFADLTIVSQGDDALISDGSGNSILLVGIDATALAESDFIFSTVLTGTSGADLIEGTYLDETLSGNGGADTITGGEGDDLLSGGSEGDTYAFAEGWGDDTISDFEVGSDRIDISSTDIGYNELSITQEGDNTVISFGSNSITLLNVAATDIDASSFETPDYLTARWGAASSGSEYPAIDAPTTASNDAALSIDEDHTVGAAEEEYFFRPYGGVSAIQTTAADINLTNEGSIFAESEGDNYYAASVYGVRSNYASALDNDGSITAIHQYGFAYGIFGTGPGTGVSLDNEGSIFAGSRFSSAFGFFTTNRTSEVIDHVNQGSIEAFAGSEHGYAYAVSLNGFANFDNQGTLTASAGGTAGGIRLGTYNNTTSSGSITNSGTITATSTDYTSYGIIVYGDQDSQPISIDNQGTITADVGVLVDTADTVLTNSGTITGLIKLGDGNDTVTGSGEFGGVISTGRGDDKVVTGAGDETIIGGAGEDTIDGGAGTDLVSYETSGAGVNINLASGQASGGSAIGDILSNIENIVGSGAMDTLVGDTQANVLAGGAARDQITGGGGNDTLTGGSGDDIFIFAAGWGTDTITDFVVGSDILDLSATGLSFSDLTISADSGDTLISDGSGNSIRLTGIASSDIDASAFSFDGIWPDAVEDRNTIAEVLGITDPWAEVPTGIYQPSFEPSVGRVTLDSEAVGEGETIYVQDGWFNNNVANEGSIWVELLDQQNTIYSSFSGVNLDNSGDIVIIHDAENNFYGNRGGIFNNSGQFTVVGTKADVTGVWITHSSRPGYNSGEMNIWSGGGYATGFEIEGQSTFVNDGTIIAQGAAGARGVRFDGWRVLDVTNNGIIRAVSGDPENGSVGITVTRIQDGHTITNTGTIEADIALQFLGNTAYDPTINNSGTLIGDLDFDNGGTFVINNTGDIHGDILLGAGHDVVDSAEGHIDGIITAGSGNDTVTGSLNDDTIHGDLGNDIVDGGEGDDLLAGGNGDDFIIGGNGDDTLTGGEGADLFTVGAGSDVITDFVVGQDIIDFGMADIDEFDDLTISSCGDDALITDADGNSLLLEGVDAADIDEANFVFGDSLARYFGITTPWTPLPDVDVRPSGDDTTLWQLPNTIGVNDVIYHSDYTRYRFTENYSSTITNNGLIWAETHSGYHGNGIYLSNSHFTNNGTVLFFAGDYYGDAFHAANDGSFVNNGDIIHITTGEGAGGGIYLNRPEFENNGLITSWSDQGTLAVQIRATDVAINRGTISAEGYEYATAVSFAGSSLGRTFVNEGTLYAASGDGEGNSVGIRLDEATVENSGTIIADIAVSGSNGEVERVENTGTITGDINLKDRNDEVINRGEISGNIDMGDAQDTVANLGQITGQINLGSGSDDLSNNGTITGTVHGDGGNDVVTNNGRIFGDVYLDAGDDNLFTHNGDIIGTVYGGNGDDLIEGGNNTDTLSGDLGDDTLSGGNGDDQLTTGDGNDVIRLTAGWGDDTVSDFDADNDRIDISRTGSNYDDLIITSCGDDALVTDADGNSLLLQNVSAGALTSDLFRLQTSEGGSDLNNNISGNAQDNEIKGYGGDDLIEASGGDDTLYGGAGHDTLDGGNGVDTAVFSDSYVGVSISLNDTVTNTSNGNRVVLRNIENIVGSVAGDRIEGDESDNQFTGLTGGDVFAFLNDWGNDTITDFNAQVDILDFGAASTVTEFADLSVDQVGDDTVITGPDGSTITLLGVTATDITSAQMNFSGTTDPTDESFDGAIADLLGIETPWAELPDVGYLPSEGSLNLTANQIDQFTDTAGITFSSLHQATRLLVGAESSSFTFEGSAISFAPLGANYYYATAIYSESERFINEGLILSTSAQSSGVVHGLYGWNRSNFDNDGTIYAVSNGVSAYGVSYNDHYSAVSTNSGHIEAWSSGFAGGVSLGTGYYSRYNGGSFVNDGTILAQGQIQAQGINASRVDITNNGTITAINGHDENRSVGVAGYSNTVINNGTITGDIAISGSAHIINNNMLDGDVSTSDQLDNHGTVTGDVTGSYYTVVNNTGTIMGNVVFGNGNQTLNSSDTSYIHGTIVAGDGDDTITGSALDDTISGDNGNDKLAGGIGDDIITGGEGSDTIAGNAGNDSLSGGNGDDTIAGGNGDDLMTGGAGYDAFEISEGWGQDTIQDFVFGEDALKLGGSLTFGDLVAEQDGANTIISDGNGNTLLINNFFAADFDASLFEPISELEGTNASDNLVSTSGTKIINAYAGNDTISGNDGNDTITGGVGSDKIDGGGGSDVVSYADSYQGVHVDLSAGTATGGNATGDTLSQIENLVGSSNNDTLTGDENDNRIDGGDYRDIITGNGGNDVLIGGSGDDVFTFAANWGADVIRDFEVGGDILDMSASGLTFADLSIVQSGDNTVISDGSGNSITLWNVTATDIDAGSFSFDGTIPATEEDFGSDTYIYDLADFDAPFALLPEPGMLPNVEFSNETLNMSSVRVIHSYEAYNFQDVSTAISTSAHMANYGRIWLVNDTNSTVNAVRITERDTLFQNMGEIVVLSQSNGYTRAIDGIYNTSVWNFGDIYSISTAGSASGIRTNGRDIDSAQGNSGLVEVWAGGDTATGVDVAGGNEYYNLGTIRAGGEDDATGIVVSANNAVAVYNTGTIEAYTGATGDQSIGILFNNIQEGHAVYNSGTITADIALRFNTTTFNYDPTIENTGTITGDMQLLGGTFNVTNTGTITGDVTMGGGNDRFNTENGTFIGILNAGAGNDTIQASSGDDTVYSGSGNDIIFTGDGNDRIGASSGNDYIDAGAGDDWIDASSGNDTLILSEGDDTLYGLSGTDVIKDANLLDYSLEQVGSHVLLTFEGEATGTLLVQHSNVQAVEQAISRGIVGQRIVGNTAANNLSGAAGDDTLIGNNGNDTLVGNAGDDLIEGDRDNDLLDGGAGNDILIGGSGDDTLDGGEGNDELIGDAGNDLLSGNNGDDSLADSDGTDTLRGGDGDDTISITGAANSLVDGGDGNDQLIVDFAQDAATTVTLTSSDAGAISTANDTVSFTDIETVTLSTDQNTQFTGSSENDIITTGAGNDTLTGGDGDDSLDAGAGTNVFRFLQGFGNDTVAASVGSSDIYDFSSSLVTLSDVTFTDVAGGTLMEDGEGNSVLFAGVSSDDINLDNFRFSRVVAGSANDDTLTGDSQDNEIWGGCGDDMMDGGSGNDTVSGGCGDDTISGGCGDDTLDGGEGADLLIGGEGTDLVMGGCGDDTVQAIFEAEEEAGPAAIRFSVLEAEQALEDASHADQVTVSNDGLSYRYEGGRNREGVASSDAMESGQHYWEITLDDVARGGGSLYVAIAAPADSDWTEELAEIEGSLMLRGNGQSYVGDGRRARVDERGLDRINEGDVIGVAFDADLGAIWISINGVWQNGATAEEIAAGDTRHAVMTGITEAYVPTAGGYDNNSRGGHTATLTFESDDFAHEAPEGFAGPVATVVGDPGDTLDGGDGIDWIDLSNASEGIMMGSSRLEATGDSTISGDIYRNFENIRGTTHADQLAAGDGDNVIEGGDGDDTLSGGNGDDTLLGGEGDDIIQGVEAGDVVDGGDGYDIVSYAHLSEGQLIIARAAHQNIEAYEGTSGDDEMLGSSGNDTLRGGDGDDSISGNGGFDSLSGGAGDDLLLVNANNDFTTLSGGDGEDTADFRQVGTSLTIDLAAGTAGRNPSPSFDLDSIEHVVGTLFGDDTITGNAGNNYLSGESGDDRLAGGCGDDTLEGGAGADTFVFEADFVSDLITDFTIGDDVIDLSAMPATFSTLVISQSGPDTIVEVPDHGEITLAGVTATDLSVDDFYFGDTSLEGTDGDDLIQGQFRDETLDGGLGDDTLRGGDGNDTLKGGDDNDLLAGEAGSDVIDGGLGNDTVQVHAGIASSASDVWDTDAVTRQVTIAEGGMTYSYEGGRNREGVGAGEEISSGQYYWEITMDEISSGGGNLYVALAAPAGSDWTQNLADIDGSLMLRGNGQIYEGDGRRAGRDEKGLDSLKEGDVIGVAFDADTGAIWISINGKWQNGATAAEVAAGDTSGAIMTGITEAYVPTAGGHSTSSRGGHTATIIVDSDSFTQSVPEGFSAYGSIGAAPTGGDTVDGGDGEDVIDFSQLETGVDMTGVSLSDVGGALIGGDLYQNMEHLIGSAQDDLLSGGDGDNNISGNCGDDTIIGGAGDDTLTGGEGADLFTLTSGFGTDTVTDFTSGEDKIDLRGSGYDYWDIVDGLGDVGGVATFNDGNGNTLTFAGIAAGDIDLDDFLFGGSIILGTSVDDTVTGTADADYMIGLDGADSLFGDAGDDTLLGSNGDDTLDGGEGFDHASLTDGDDQVNLETGVAILAEGEGTDQLIDIEAAHGGCGDDTLIGSGDDDLLTGDAGDDVLMGAGGDDTLTGGTGADSFVIGDGWGSDTITDFTVGTDVLDFSASSLSFGDLAVTEENGNAIISDGAGNSLTLDGVTAASVDASLFSFGDTITGTAGADSLVGSLGRDSIVGLDDNDTLLGGGSNDTLVGGNGDDLLAGGAGSDLISGGEGDDTVAAYQDESASSTGLDDASHASQVTVLDGLTYSYDGGRSREGVAATDELSSGQHYWEITLDDVARAGGNLYVAIAAPADSDWTEDLAAISGSLMLRGNGQTYVGDGRRAVRDERGLDGLGEGDVIGVAFDADTGAIWISINGEWQNGATAAEIAAGDTSGAVMTGITEAYVPTAGGYDGSTRGGHTATIVANAADFTYSAPDGFAAYGGDAAGGDTVDGGEGFDVIDLSGLSDGIDMSGTALSDEGGALIGADLYQNFEAIVGTDHDDILNGGTGNNDISGGDGNDTVTGGAGNDTLTGGNGADVYLFGADFGADVIEDFDTGNDRLDLRGAGISFDIVLAGLTQDGADAVFEDGNGNSLRLAGVTASDITVSNFVINGTVVLGTAAADTLDGGSDDEYMIGSAGDDLVLGSDGSDTLDGGAGNDTLEGGRDDDTLVGGQGSDVLTGDQGADRFVLQDAAVNSSVTVTDFDTDEDILDLSQTDVTAENFLNSVEEITQGGVAGTLVNDDDGDTIFLQGVSIGELVGANVLFSGETDLTVTTSGSRIRGGNREDTIDGTAGGEEIDGRNGNDVIDGGAGNDTIKGGRDDDRFVMSDGTGNDIIEDFSLGDDILDLSGTNTTFSTLSDVLDAATETTRGRDEGVLIDLGGGDSVFIEGVSLGELTLMTIIGDGSVILDSAGSDDTFRATSDAETFTFTSGHGNDVITGFDVDEDTLDLTALNITDLSGQATETTLGRDKGVLIDTGDGNTIFIEDLTLSDLLAVSTT
ncbi:MAG: hypothetical protein HWE25_07440 [Alphaproteobacteria bacterium]|nr:hypothetical protein [Alphaproteobacteria bacterium]